MTIMIVLGAILLYLSGVVASYIFTVVYYYHRPEKIAYYWFDPPPKDYMTNKKYKLKAAKLEAVGCFGLFILSWAFFVAVFIAGCIYYSFTYVKSGCDRLVKYIIKY